MTTLRAHQDRRTRPIARNCTLSKVAGVAAVTLSVLICGSVAGASTPREVRLGRAPQRPSDARALGSLSADARLAVLVTLKPQTGLAAYAKAVSTPGSGLYHHYLSVPAFRERFGASQQTIDAVTDSLRTGGLDPGAVSANGLAITVSASAARLSRAFRTSFERVRLPSGRVAFTNTSAPELSAAASPHVQAILGLNSLSPPMSTDLARGGSPDASSSAHVRAHVSPNTGPTPNPSCLPEGHDPAQPGSDYYWTADEIAEAYGLSGYYSVGDEGAGQTIALLELEPDLTSDVTAYEDCYGLTGSAAPTINYVEVDGGDGSGLAAGGAGSGEAALDIEQVVGLAPQATVDVYQAPDGGTTTGFVDALQAMIDNSAVNVISDSWGTCEPSVEGPGDDYADLTSENVLLEQAAAEGKTVFAASGDSGSSGCYVPDSSPGSTPAVDDPASQPYVTGTGGTSLPGSDEAADPAGQSVWNDGGGASGGGISAYWPMPTWQSSAAAGLGVIGPDSSGAPCHAASGDYCREVPDVSGDGDPQTGYPIYCSGSCYQGLSGHAGSGWWPVAGTSAVAPLWAAYTALVNDSSVCNRKPIGFANPLLYEAADSSYASNFTDVTAAGNNDDAASGYTGGLYPVATGYDMATGLGTPIGGTLGNTLCDEADTVTLSEPAAQTTAVGATVNLALTASDSEGHGIGAFSATGLPPGISINSATGAITGVPTQAGRYNAAVTATASLTGAHTSKSFSWQVLAAVTTRTASFTLDNQKLALTTPIEQTCAAPSTGYRVKFTTAAGSASRAAKLTFKTVAFYIDRGLKRVRTQTQTVHGHRRTVKVTSYVPNATSKSASSSESLHLKGLSRGTHTLRLLVTYTRTTVSGGKRRTVTVSKTITARFKVC